MYRIRRYEGNDTRQGAPLAPSKISDDVQEKRHPQSYSLVWKMCLACILYNTGIPHGINRQVGLQQNLSS